MEPKLLLSFILLSSCVSMGFSQGFVGGLVGDSSCITKLIPCQASLKDPSELPPPTCCDPLKTMIADDLECLCRIYDNEKLLDGFDISGDDLLELPKGCGITVDIASCPKAAAAPTNSPADSPVPAASNGTTGNSTGSPPPNPPAKKNSAYGISPFCGLGFIAPFVALVLSAF